MTQSFDLFDTLCVRAVPHPSDLHYITAEILAKDQRAPLKMMGFYKARVEAESIAVSKKQSHEVNIQEIYNELSNEIRNCDQSTKKLIKLELAIEYLLTYPIKSNIRRLSKDSVIISDTYLPRAHIQRIYKKIGIKPCATFLSHEKQISKHSGSLFEYVSELYAINKHIGDNIDSDYNVPNHMGIVSEISTISRLSKYEQMAYQNSNSNIMSRILMSGAMRVTRVSESYAKKSDTNLSVQELASNIIAPVLFSYAYWVVMQAIKDKREILYFVSRDAQTIFKIAKKILVVFAIKSLKIKYIYGSRKAWHLPASSGVHDIDWVFERTSTLTIKDICSRLDISPTTFEEYMDNLHIRSISSNISNEDLESIKKIIVRDKKISQKIEDKIREKRRVVLQYLRTIGVQRHKKVGFVDLGWKGRQQASFSKLLMFGNIYPSEGVAGYYYALLNPSRPFKKDVYFSYLTDSESKRVGVITGLLESFASADHGSCTGYGLVKKRISPILRNNSANGVTNRILEQQRKVVLDFSEILLNTLKLLPKENLKLSFKEIASELLVDFMHYPSKRLSQIYSHVIMYEDQEERVQFRMCEHITTSELLRRIVCGMEIRNHNLWVEGSISISYAHCAHFWQHLINFRRTIGAILRK